MNIITEASQELTWEKIERKKIISYSFSQPFQICDSQMA